MQPVTTSRAPGLRRSESSSATSIDSRRAASMNAHVFTTTRSASAADAAGVIPSASSDATTLSESTASVPVWREWSVPAAARRGGVVAPGAQRGLAAGVVNEPGVDDEVSAAPPHAHAARIEEPPPAAAGLLEEPRPRLDDLESEGRI